MLTATLLALSAAFMHAGWNLAIKRSAHDRFVTMWGQMLVSGLLGGGVLISLGGVHREAWMWAGLSSLIQVPYALLLSSAYDTGDFSQVYPLARGAGAFLAAVGGIVLLGDDVELWSAIAILIVVCGLVTLVGRARGPAVVFALGAAVAIGAYTLLDSKGSRASGVAYYGLATAFAGGTTMTAYGVATRRRGELAAAFRTDGRSLIVGGIAQNLTYTFVLAAVRLTTVGYVTAIRESSVIIAALIGWKYLGEGHAERRLTASAIVLTGLILLVATA